jgi:hypothetical protein
MDTDIHVQDNSRTVLLKSVLHLGGCRKTMWFELVTACGLGAWNYGLSGKRILESVAAVGCASCKGTGDKFNKGKRTETKEMKQKRNRTGI